MRNLRLAFLVILASCGGDGAGVVIPPVVTVASVTVSPGTDTVIALGATQLSAVAKDSAGNTINGRTVTWASLSPAVAGVSATGNVTSAAMGTATITATVSGVTGQATVIVAPDLVITPQLPSAFAGDTLQLAAKPTNLNRDTIPGATPPIAWSSSNTAVATVSAAGVVTTVAQGTAIITAVMAGGLATTVVAVLASPAHPNREVSYLAEYPRADGARPTRLRLVNANGSGAINITDTPDFVSQYAWSPDGSRVAVVFLNFNGQGKTGIWLVNADGSSPTQLVPWASIPSGRRQCAPRDAGGIAERHAGLSVVA